MQWQLPHLTNDYCKTSYTVFSAIRNSSAKSVNQTDSRNWPRSSECFFSLSGSKIE